MEEGEREAVEAVLGRGSGGGSGERRQREERRSERAEPREEEQRKRPFLFFGQGRRRFPEAHEGLQQVLGVKEGR